MADNVKECLGRFELLRPEIYKRVLKVVNSREATEDILQDIQVKILEKPETLRLETLNAWIFRVAYNLAFDELKRSNREQHSSINTPEEESIAEKIGCYDPSFELQVEYTELHKILDAYLRQLPIDNACLIGLHCLEGLSYAKIGKKLGKPMSTVRSKIQRGLKKLRNLLQEGGFDKNAW